MGNYPYRPAKSKTPTFPNSGKANLIVGEWYRVVQSGNFPDMVERVGVLKKCLPYLHAVKLEIDGMEYQFTAEQLAPAARPARPKAATKEH